MSTNDRDRPERQEIGDAADWLVQLIRAPAGAVVTARPGEARAPGEPDEGAAPGLTPAAAGPPDGAEAAAADAGGSLKDVALDMIRPGPGQPRRTIDEAELRALADSIAAQGVIQPIVVRPVSDAAAGYEIVAGERRWRAARMAGLATIPALVRTLGDEQMAEVALVENIQRAELPPLDEASAYRQLMERHGLTQDDIARRLGKGRTHVAHMLRLLRLPSTVHTMIRDGRLSVGHARVLVNAADPEALANRVLAEGLTVRQTEEAAKAGRGVQDAPAESAAAPSPSARQAAAWAERIGAALQRPVTVKSGRKGGSVVIRYDDEEDLASIVAKMGG